MLCTKIRLGLKGLLKKFDNYVDAHIDTALKITTDLKKVLSSPVADIITAIIPGDADNKIQAHLVSALSKSIEALTIADSCKEVTDVNENLKCFVTQLQQREPNLQDAILQKLASLLAGHLDGQRLKQNLYDLFTQAKYAASKVQQ